MASLKLGAGYQIHMNTIDFSSLYYGSGYYQSKVSYVIAYQDGFVDFRGSGFRYDSQGVPVGGMINSYAIIINGDRALTVSGFHESVPSFVHAATSFSIKDDQHLLADIFSGKDSISGAGVADILMGYDGNDKLTGGAGNDKLVGGDGSDTFVFSQGFGKDTISDFDAVGSDHDTIRFTRVKGIHHFGDVKPLIERHHQDAWIDIGQGEVIVLHHAHAHDLTKADFSFQ